MSGISGWDKPTLEWWRGEDGDAYMRRNAPTPEYIAMRAETFRGIFGRLPTPVQSILEVGCGPGANLAAIASISRVELTGIDPNASAREVSRSLCQGYRLAGPTILVVDDHAGGIRFSAGMFDLVMTCGVLIHLDPTKKDGLKAAIREIYRVARRYILIMEYFSPQPMAVKYRGAQEGLLWKLDYGAEFLAAHPDLLVVDYGFLWSKRTAFDDLNWWLLQKPEVAQP